MKFISLPILAALATRSAHAFTYKNPVSPDKVQGFEWKDPFRSDAIAAFNPSCESNVSFGALEYTLHDLSYSFPDGLKTWANGLRKVFSGREYPGGWAGFDRHLHDRSLLLMDYDKIPIAVREWIEEEEREDGKGKALFAIFEKPKQKGAEPGLVVKFPSADKIDRSEDKQRIAIFSPGVLYSILPLWAADASKCENTLLDLSNYKTKPTDRSVVAWVNPTNIQDHKMQFDIQVQFLEEIKAPGEAKQKGIKEEL